MKLFSKIVLVFALSLSAFAQKTQVPEIASGQYYVGNEWACYISLYQTRSKKEIYMSIHKNHDVEFSDCPEAGARAVFTWDKKSSTFVVSKQMKSIGEEYPDDIEAYEIRVISPIEIVTMVEGLIHNVYFGGGKDN